MKSPFPGMDPFIEPAGLWGDFHEKLIGEIERNLSQRIPERYVLRLARRTYIELTDVDDESHWMIPDVGIARRRSQTGRKSTGAKRGSERGVTMLEQPVSMHALVDVEYRETYLEIHEAGESRRLVTCIEVLSPANKRSDSVGWMQYVRKRQALMQGAANLVEIDLLRGGERMPMREDWPDSPYYLSVARKEAALQCLVWPAGSLRPLPTIPIPLLPSDADINLDLQPLIDAVYERSRYAGDIDCRKSIPTPLSTEELGLLSRLKKPPRRSGRN